jgi:hypothetical protein
MKPCIVLEGCSYRESFEPAKEFTSAASFHNHSHYSREDLAPLNGVMARSYMRPIAGLVQFAFGVERGNNIDYRHLYYHPPITPRQVHDIERERLQTLGFEYSNFALTDHDEIGGALDLIGEPANFRHTAVAEELSLVFEGHLFHLGIVGLASNNAPEVHAKLQSLAREKRFDEFFDLLSGLGCLVTLNHPLVAWDGGPRERIPVENLLERYHWAIHGFEYNGMRPKEENDAVLQLAQKWKKPVHGGGDTHSTVPSPAVVVSREARTMDEFIQDGKEGRLLTLLLPEYFIHRDWKIFLRVINFIGRYRDVAGYKGEPIEKHIGKFVLLDLMKWPCRTVLKVASALNLEH